MESGARHIDTSTRLAVDRTRLAFDRTLLAWVRTAASLISFGFTVYKFFQYEFKNRPPVEDHILGPREFALGMIVVGLVSLFLSALQYRQHMQGLRSEYGVAVPVSIAGIVAGLFSVLGLVALVAVLLER